MSDTADEAVPLLVQVSKRSLKALGLGLTQYRVTTRIDMSSREAYYGAFTCLIPFNLEHEKLRVHNSDSSDRPTSRNPRPAAAKLNTFAPDLALCLSLSEYAVTYFYPVCVAIVGSDA